MIKNMGKLLAFLFFLNFLLFFSYLIVDASEVQQVPIVMMRNTILTEEQKEQLENKKVELKDKYLKNYEHMTEKQKERAMEQYRDELRRFCEDELGLKFDQKQFDRLKKKKFRFNL